MIAGIDKRLRSPRQDGAARAPRPLRHRLGRGRRRRGHDRASGSCAGARPRDFAILVRSNADADPFLRALERQGPPAPLQRQPRALRARGGAAPRLVPARAREPRRLGLALLPLRVRGVPPARGRPPAPQPVRAAEDAGRSSRCLRGLPDERGPARRCRAATREAAARLLADLDARGRRGAAAAHRRGALRLPAVRRGSSAPAVEGGERRGRGARSRTSRASSRR